MEPGRPVADPNGVRDRQMVENVPFSRPLDTLTQAIEPASQPVIPATVSLLLFALLASSAPAASDPRDWGATLRMDAQALHDEIKANHPGPVNAADPGFEKRNDAQLARALKRAKSAKTFADYFYAMQEYTASFNDGHMSYGVFGATPDQVRRWPGFLTRYDGNGKQVVFVSEPWSGVPKGARLVSCDGLSADQVATKRIGSRFGRWKLESQRVTFGAMTFLDTGDRYVGTINRCRFAVGGKTIDVALDWRAPETNLYTAYDVFPKHGKPTSQWRRLADGTQWFSIPSFDGNPDGDAGKSLRSLIDYIQTNGDQVRSAPAIVFDLRGNGGGSSDWSYQIAKQLWGEGTIEAHPEPPMTVSWRASPGNLEDIRKGYEERSKGGHLAPEVADWFKQTIAGLDKTIARHKALWVIPPGPDEDNAKSGPKPEYALAGPVYVLTDASCMSACLDAVDLWTRLGAIPIGHETGADTLYMEVRMIKLPAGVGGVSMPMKVYSGRARASNQPVVPRYRFDGDIADTAAVERWVATLPKR